MTPLKGVLGALLGKDVVVAQAHFVAGASFLARAGAQREVDEGGVDSADDGKAPSRISRICLPVRRVSIAVTLIVRDL